MGRVTFGGLFGGVCELSMSLGSLSVNGGRLCSCFLVVWHVVSSTRACWPLGGAGLSVETEISGRALTN